MSEWELIDCQGQTVRYTMNDWMDGLMADGECAWEGLVAAAPDQTPLS
jgi:hypothetical protein